MPLDPVKLFNPAGPDRVAVLSAETSFGNPGQFLLRLARGPSTKNLSGGGTFGPFNETELTARFAELLDSLHREGFLPSGMHGLLERLFSDDPRRRGRAAKRLAWTDSPRAADALLAALPKAVDEACAIIDALGLLREKRAIPTAREFASRKLLSRRRSGVEALWNLGDAEGLAQARTRTIEQLPPPVRTVLLSIDEKSANDEIVTRIVGAVGSVEEQRRGLCADLLYELVTPAPVEAARRLVAGMTLAQPFVWRYAKSILKRAMLRFDFVTIGLLLHLIESQGLANPGGVKAKVKSGYDGKDREVKIFARPTRDYLRRAGWRLLCDLSEFRPDLYAPAAAEMIIHYTENDLAVPDKLHGAMSRSYLLHRVLLGSSPRFLYRHRSMRFRFKNAASAKAPPPTVREEAFPELWDRQPQAYLRLLGGARLADVQQFAHAGLTRHPDLLRQASVAQLAAMLAAPFEKTFVLALSELRRRFDPQKPDFDLILKVASDARQQAFEIGQQWMRETAAEWTLEPRWIEGFISSANPSTRALVAELVLPTLNGAGPDLRRRIAKRLWPLLLLPGDHEATARVCREALLTELDALFETDQILNAIETAPDAAKAVAADLLARRPQAATAMGLVRLATLTQHPLAAVRSAAARLIAASEPLWRDDPSILFLLTDSEWDEIRATALELIRTKLDVARLGATAVLGLIDSNRPDVQDAGMALARSEAAKLDLPTLLELVSEHPHPHVRPFVLELAMIHLPPGAATLSRLERFFRTALLDPKPSRPLKRDIVELLKNRALLDPDQAAIAQRLLHDMLRFDATLDFEQALEVLARIQLAWPELGGEVIAGGTR
jgi:hypothetical protein